MISLNQALKAEAILFGSKDTVVVSVNNAGIEQAVITKENEKFTVAIPGTKVTLNDFVSVLSFMDNLRTCTVK